MERWLGGWGVMTAEWHGAKGVLRGAKEEVTRLGPSHVLQVTGPFHVYGQELSAIFHQGLT